MVCAEGVFRTRNFEMTRELFEIVGFANFATLVLEMRLKTFGVGLDVGALIAEGHGDRRGVADGGQQARDVGNWTLQQAGGDMPGRRDDHLLGVDPVAIGLDAPAVSAATVCGMSLL